MGWIDEYFLATQDCPEQCPLLKKGSWLISVPMQAKPTSSIIGLLRLLECSLPYIAVLLPSGGTSTAGIAVVL